jgi:hypothetical protein
VTTELIAYPGEFDCLRGWAGPRDRDFLPKLLVIFIILGELEAPIAVALQMLDTLTIQ